MKKQALYRAVSLALTGVIGLSVAGCGSSSTSSQTSTDSTSTGTTASAEADVPEGSIELAYNLTTDDFAKFQQIIQDFTDETGIAVTINNLGGDYESAMKTKMASNDLPDVWVTHGWSLIRYSEYMMDLSDQEWVSKIDTGLKSVITNDDGELFILPITQSVGAIEYNIDVLEEAGVDPADIRTWDDFNTACQKVADIGKTPIEIVLGDSYNSYSLELMWPSELTNDGVADQTANITALQDGSFDWTQHTDCYDLMATWFENGWYNEDYASGKRDQVLQALANGDAAFTFFSTGNIPQIHLQNADANIGILPIPAFDENSPSYFGIGEGNYSCFGIWKDTPYADNCKKLLEYLAQPEIAAQIVAYDGGIPGLTDTTVESGTNAAYTSDALKTAQAAFDGDLYYDNFFDRKYLPSGMWSVMADSVDTFLATGDPASVKEEAVGIVADNYNDLMGN